MIYVFFENIKKSPSGDFLIFEFSLGAFLVLSKCYAGERELKIIEITSNLFEFLFTLHPCTYDITGKLFLKQQCLIKAY